MKYDSIIGIKFNRLTAIKTLPAIKQYKKRVLCRCDCGKECIVEAYALCSGKSKSCGCLKRDILLKRSTIHGEKNRTKATAEYTSWCRMKRRCYNKNDISFPLYGGRGIKVCERWLNSYDNFLADMGRRPSPNHSLDRYPNNTDGNYEPSNCRWATNEQQMGNKRTNKWYTYGDKTMIRADWARFFNIKPESLCYYLKKKSFKELYEHYTSTLSLT